MENSYKTRETLIQRLKNQHDDASWDDFVGIYRDYIYSIIRKMNISEYDSEDLLQQVLITLWSKIPETDLKQIKRFRSWVAAIAKNCVIDFIRKRTREAKRLETAAQDETISYLNAIRLPEVNSIAEKEWKLHVTNLAFKNIESLFSGHALEVFQLSLQGVETCEIATRLGLKERSVYQLKGRVKIRLTEEIERLRSELE